MSSRHQRAQADDSAGVPFCTSPHPMSCARPVKSNVDGAKTLDHGLMHGFGTFHLHAVGAHANPASDAQGTGSACELGTFRLRAVGARVLLVVAIARPMLEALCFAMARPPVPDTVGVAISGLASRVGPLLRK